MEISTVMPDDAVADDAIDLVCRGSTRLRLSHGQNAHGNFQVLIVQDDHPHIAGLCRRDRQDMYLAME